MGVGTADLIEAVVTTWNNSLLNSLFQAYWITKNKSEFFVLHDSEAPPSQSFPYCVFEVDEGQTTSKMSGGPSLPVGRREIRDILWEFRIHTRSIPGGLTAKALGAALASEVIKVFGGHPETAPVLPVLAHGSVLNVVYRSEFSTRDGDNEYTWHLKYLFSVDVPVAA